MKQYLQKLKLTSLMAIFFTSILVIACVNDQEPTPIVLGDYDLVASGDQIILWGGDSHDNDENGDFIAFYDWWLWDYQNQTYEDINPTYNTWDNWIRLYDPGYYDVDLWVMDDESTWSSGYDTWEVTVVGIDDVTGNGESDSVVVALGESVELVASKDPSGASWPDGWPKWYMAVGQGEHEEIDNTAGNESVTLDSLTTGVYNINVWCGASWDSITVYVGDLKITSPIGMNDHKFVFDANLPDGICEFNATATTGLGAAWDDKIIWNIDSISGSVLTYDPSTKKGPTMKIRYRCLPSSNSEFGKKSLSISHPDIAGTGSNSVEVEIYYTSTANNWPGAEPMAHAFNPNGSKSWACTWKNWFYYYKQTSAHTGCTYYHNQSQCDPMQHPDYTAYIGPLAQPYQVTDYNDYRSGIYVTDHGQSYYGIDCFAYSSRHEKKHHDDYNSWWGANGIVTSNDTDGDRMPDNDEASFNADAGGRYQINCQATHDPSNLTNGMPGPDNWDDQVECLFTQPSWGAANQHKDLDWAYPGSRWH